MFRAPVCGERLGKLVAALRQASEEGGLTLSAEPAYRYRYVVARELPQLCVVHRTYR